MASNGQEFLHMPFGLCVASAYFQRYINAVFADLIAEDVVVIYINDLIITKSTNTRLKNTPHRMDFYIE